MTNPAALLADPAWLAHRYDETADAIQFRRTTRAEHAAATFITDEYLAPATPTVIARATAFAAAPPPAPLHFIFHSAFCCSTLLARALDVPGVATTLKEPVILNDLEGWRHRGAPRGAVAQALDQALTLLARPFEPDERVLIKPSNLINSFLPVILAMRPASQALLLYAPLDTFLRSIAKKGMWGRVWVRDLLVKQLRGGMINLGFETEQYLAMTDLQAAAVTWLAQHALFGQIAAQFPARVRTLDSETLLARPAEVIAALADLFDLRLDADAVAAIVAGPGFTRHSKFGGDFTPADRSAEYDAAHAVHGDEIDKVGVWAAAVAQGAGVKMDLPGRLLG